MKKVVVNSGYRFYFDVERGKALRTGQYQGTRKLKAWMRSNFVSSYYSQTGAPFGGDRCVGTEKPDAISATAIDLPSDSAYDNASATSHKPVLLSLRIDTYSSASVG